MKVSLVSQVTIKAKPGEVFKYLTDTRYHRLWNPHVRHITAKKLHEGGNYKVQSVVLGISVDSKIVVTKLVPDQEVELRNDTGLLKHITNIRLRRKGIHTLVLCATTVSADSKAFAFAKPVLSAFGRRELQSDLQGLKIAVEESLEPDF